MQIAPPMVSVQIGPLMAIIVPVTQAAGGGVISLIVISIPLPVGLVRWRTHSCRREPNN